MKKYTMPTLLCAGLLLVSALARALLEWPPFVAYFPYLMWVQVAVIALAFYGFWVLHKAPRAHLGGLEAFVRGVPIWLASLALPVAFAAAPMFSLATSSLGTTPDGQPVHSKSWVQEGDRHYAVLNRTVRVEITEVEYTEVNRVAFVAFSSGWILFSYLTLVLWHYNRRRECLGNAGPPFVPPDVLPRASPASLGRTKGPQLVAVALWLLLLADGVRQGLNLSEEPLYSGFQFNGFGSAVVLLPIVFFSIAPLWMNGHPFDAKPVREWINAKYGSETYESYTRAIRPLALFAAVGFVIGATAMASALRSGAAQSAFVLGGFFVSSGVGLLVLPLCPAQATEHHRMN